MNLTKHFTLEEMTKSSTADRLHIANTPGPYETENLGILCREILEPLRNQACQPITVNSAYRCKKLNKAIGGVSNSYHIMGMAADIHCETDKQANAYANILIQLPLTDLVLIEFTRSSIWIHVQWSHNPRHKINRHYNA